MNHVLLCILVGALAATTTIPASANQTGRTFYVDSASGHDESDGLSAERAWKTLDRVNAAELQPGDVVRFRRGGLWRGSLKPASGDETAPVTYTNYGQGEKPLFYGSKPRNRDEDWVWAGETLWATLPMEFHPGELVQDLRQSTWRHHQEAGAKVALKHEKTEQGVTLTVACTQSGQKSNHVQLWGPKVTVEAGTHLRLKFRGRSSVPFRLTNISINGGSAPWTRFASAAVDGQLTTEWRDFEAIFQVDKSSDEGLLHLSLGGFLPAKSVFELQLGSLQKVTPNISDPLDVDVGNIIFDHGAACGWKKWSVEALESCYDYYYDAPSQRVFLKLAVHPASRHQSIELAMKRHVVNQGGAHHVVYDGLTVMYGAAHGFGGGSTDHIVIRNCDLGYIGGGHQFTHPGGRPVRFGNAIEFWGAASNHLVENCRIWEVYDAALTNQNKGATVRQENITYRNNVIWNSEYSFEYWNRPESSVTKNVRFVNNTCVNAGVVWSHAQRPNPNGSHLMLYSNDAATSGFEIKDNIFCGVTDWGSRYTGGWKTLPDMNHNLWFSNEGVMVYWFRDRIESFADYQQETKLDAQSIFADPKFVDPEHNDFRLAADSPARKLRPDGRPIGAESLWK